jgi:transcriptional regulator with XRE-family HTH domain
MNLNEKIYAYRKQLNLSQEALADKLNVSRQAVSKWESGQAKPDIDNLIVMAQLFKVTLDELITDKTPQAADIALHLTAQKRQFLRIGVITVITFLAIGALTVSLLLQQLAEVRQLAQDPTSQLPRVHRQSSIPTLTTLVFHRSTSDRGIRPHHGLSAQRHRRQFNG